MTFNNFVSEFKTKGKPGKYLSKKTNIDGMWFDSQKEATYYCRLKLRQRAGDIASFERQVPYRYLSDDGKKVLFKYIADFVVELKTGEKEIIDVKGRRLPLYILKKKLIEDRLKIKIIEV